MKLSPQPGASGEDTLERSDAVSPDYSTCLQLLGVGDHEGNEDRKMSRSVQIRKTQRWPPPPGVRGMHAVAAPRDACGSGGGNALRCCSAAVWSTDAQDAQTPLPSADRRTKQHRLSAAVRLRRSKPAPRSPITDSWAHQSQAARVGRLSGGSQSEKRGGRRSERRSADEFIIEVYSRGAALCIFITFSS